MRHKFDRHAITKIHLLPNKQYMELTTFPASQTTQVLLQQDISSAALLLPASSSATPASRVAAGVADGSRPLQNHR